MIISLVNFIRHIKSAYIFRDHSISLFVNNISPELSVLLLSYPSATVAHSCWHCWRAELKT